MTFFTFLFRGRNELPNVLNNIIEDKRQEMHTHPTGSHKHTLKITRVSQTQRILQHCFIRVDGQMDNRRKRGGGGGINVSE